MKEKYESIIDNIKQAYDQRNYSSSFFPELIAVSKKFNADHIRPLLELGHRHYGENRVQEAAKKWPALKEIYQDVCLHLIGPLQSNKAEDAVKLFDVIHSVDRPKIAKILGKEMAKQNKSLKCFIQVNTGEEKQKSGLFVQDLEDFYLYAKDECQLDIVGLMCIPPIDAPVSLHFSLLRSYAEKLSLPHLSMGMSGDYEEALHYGATYIRVGSALFGERPLS